MARIQTKIKKIIKIISLVLAGVAAIGLLGWGIKALTKTVNDNLKTIHPTFSVGSLGNDGKYKSDGGSLYTKNAFKCAGLQVKLDFDNEISYQIFFYDDLDNFIESTGVLTEAYSGGLHDSYARIVITPTNDENAKISLAERLKYSSQMEIKVSKKQNVKYYDVFSKRLKCIDSLTDVRFNYGEIQMSDDSYNFVSSSHYAVTSSDILSVKGGYTIKPVSEYNRSDSTYRYLEVKVFEFKEKNGKFELLAAKPFSAYCTFTKDTTHIVFVVGQWEKHESSNDRVDLSSELLVKLNSLLVISK